MLTRLNLSDVTSKTCTKKDGRQSNSSSRKILNEIDGQFDQLYRKRVKKGGYIGARSNKLLRGKGIVYK